MFLSYVVNLSITIKLLLCHSLVRSVFLFSNREVSSPPMEGSRNYK